MVKKLKAMAQEHKDGAQMADAIKESAHQIWLAGLGAFSKAREERTKTFEILVREGKNLQRKTRELAEERIGEVAGRVNEVREKMNKQATESWDKLEQVFEDRVSRALGRLGVPTLKDLQAITDRLDAMGAGVPAAAAGAGAKASKATAKPTGKQSKKAATPAPTKAAKAPKAPKAPKATKVTKASKAAAPKASTATAAKATKAVAPKAAKKPAAGPAKATAAPRTRKVRTAAPATSASQSAPEATAADTSA